MIRVLFVDDEPKLLEGLQRMLRPQRREWEMMFASGGNEALAVMEKSPVDVVVTDMRMPGMDGAALLEHVYRRFPGVMRIVLSGQFDPKDGMRAASVAHQFLTKPCDPAELKAIIEKSSRSCGYVPDEATRRVVSAIGSLPSPPRTCTELAEAFRDPAISIEAIGRIINRDVALTAKVLQLVNSAFFSLPQRISDISSAAAFLGIDVLRQLVMSAGILSTFRPQHPVCGFSLEKFERHAQITAVIAGKLSGHLRPPGLSVMAALLHDTGKLVLATHMTEQFEHAVYEATARRIPSYQSELETFGTSHAEIGGYLLNLWGLPDEIVDVISVHHRPGARGLAPAYSVSGQMDPLAAVHVASALANELAPARASLPPPPTGLDMDYLTAKGLAGRIPEWRASARQIVF